MGIENIAKKMTKETLEKEINERFDKDIDQLCLDETLKNKTKEELIKVYKNILDLEDEKKKLEKESREHSGP